MRLYFKTVIIFFLYLLVTRILIYKIPAFDVVAYFLFTALSMGGISIIISIIARILPKSVFKSENILFNVHPFEKKIYEKLGIRKWKTKVPDAGKVLNIKKKSLDGVSKEYLERFIIETRYSEFVHVSSAFFGFSTIFIVTKYIMRIVFPTLCVNAILHFMPAIIQRYNRPRLLRAYQRALNQENYIVNNG